LKPQTSFLDVCGFFILLCDYFLNKRNVLREE